MRNPMRTALFPFVALCLVSPLTFADSRDQDAYVLPDSGGCAVWAPSTLISYYVNSVANDLRQEKARTDHRQQQEESRQRFLEFTRKNAIHAWVTLRQLDENPFRWENKTVGLVVRLDTMLTRDSALIYSGMRNEGGYAYLSGITPEFPGSENSVLLAVQVGVREKPADERTAYVNLRHIDSRLCERAACADWFMWGRTQDVNWGQPFQPR
ncbi:hypothetical protein FACS1894154_11260 [Betaproteobacteria bacterium]|nr:hypothetical protein FACS1894154_11260 [Betaproteobacteria bacterium]GHU22440.1 hypothetical protein FACS189488_02980 [Betaproteobacteria bacterium]